MKQDAAIRVLVIEDNDQRIELFRSWFPADIQTVFAKTAGRAIHIIELDPGNIYAGILLDHDLCEQVILGEERNFNGMDVVVKIAQLVSRNVPILIHSMNFGGGSSMRRMLQSHGFSVTRVPFRYMTEELLLDWVEDVRAEWQFGRSQ